MCFLTIGLGYYWPADEYLFIQLTVNNTVDDFYSEALGIMLELLGSFTVLRTVKFC